MNLFVIKNSVFRAVLLQFPQERLDVRVMNFTAQPTTCVSTITGSVMEKKTALMGLMNWDALHPHRSQHPPTDLLMLQTATLTRTCVCGSLLGSQIWSGQEIEARHLVIRQVPMAITRPAQVMRKTVLNSWGHVTLVFSHQLNSKSNGPIFFKTIIRQRNCFLSSGL